MKERGKFAIDDRERQETIPCAERCVRLLRSLSCSRSSWWLLACAPCFRQLHAAGRFGSSQILQGSVHPPLQLLRPLMEPRVLKLS